MARISYPSLEKLRSLLADVDSRKLALPDFQRDFVWKPGATVELIESILQNYPAGSLLRIENENGSFFKPREVAGAPALDGHSPSHLVLDGQQRLTSLYQALYGKGNHRYFMNLRELLDGGDIDDWVFCMPKRKAERRYGTIDKQAGELVFPLEFIFGHSHGFEEWLDRVLKWHKEEGNDAGEGLKEQLRDLRRTWIENIEDYEFPVVTLPKGTEAEAVCNIFETLNNTGKPLSVFDLLVARFWPRGLRLRELWDEAQTQYPVLKTFEVDPYHIFQAIALFTKEPNATPSCKRSDVLNLREVEQIRDGWEGVVYGVAETLQILRDDCGVVGPKWLPYKPILIPAGAALAKYRHARGPEVGAIRNKMRRWFWCSVFGQLYEQGTISRAAKDYGELVSWFAGEAEPESVSKFRFDPDVLRETASYQGAVYRGCIALILCGGARDFHSGSPITVSMISEKQIDDHHVFPKGYLDDMGEELSENYRDCVLNRTLIDGETNTRIGKKGPADYLGEIEEILGPKDLEMVLESHLLPGSVDSPLRRGQFTEFLEERQKWFAREIKRAVR